MITYQKHVILILTLIQYYGHLHAQSVQLANTNYNKQMNTTSGYVLGLDLDQFKVKGKKKVAFFDQKGLIISVDNIPYFLMASPDFDPSNISDELQNDFSRVENVIFRPPLNIGEKKPEKYYQIPSWLTNLSYLNYLRLDHAEVDNLLFLQKMEIKHLVINDIITKNRKILVNDICGLKQLKYLASDFKFSSQEIIKIKASLPDVVILSEDEYYKKLDNGEITL